MPKPKHGDIVKFTHKMVRMRHPVGDRKSWTPIPCEGQGIYLGPRVKQNGVVHIPENCDALAWFVPDEYITVALVSVDLRSQPLPVCLEGLEVVS